MEPGAGNVPEVPEVPEVLEVPDAMGSVAVRCRDCANFDPESTPCLKRDRPVDPKVDRRCSDFAVPF